MYFQSKALNLQYKILHVHGQCPFRKLNSTDFVCSDQHFKASSFHLCTLESRLCCVLLVLLNSDDQNSKEPESNQNLILDGTAGRRLNMSLSLVSAVSACTGLDECDNSTN